MLERLLVEQRLGVARAQQAQVAPGDRHHLFDEIVHSRLGWLQISAPTARHQRRRRPPRRRLAVHRLARALRQGPRRISARTEEAVRAAAAGARLPARTSPRARCAPASRAASALVVPDITNPFFGRVLRGAQRGRAAGRLHGRAGRHRQRPRLGGRSRCEALLAGPADGLLLFEAELPPGRDRARDPDRDAARRAAGRAARRRGGRGLRARRTCSSSATADRPRRPRASTRRRSTCAATGSPRGWRRPDSNPPRASSAPFTFDGARRGGRAAAGPGGFTAVLCDDDILAGGVYLAARDARAVGSPRTCPSSASTTSTSRACSRRR